MTTGLGLGLRLGWGRGNSGTALSAPTLTRTSGVSTYPMTATITRPVDWDTALGTITFLMQVSDDPTFATGVTEFTAEVTGPDNDYYLGLDTITTPNVGYARLTGYQNGRPAANTLNWSGVIGVGDSTAPTITSSNTITLASGVGGTLNLTANELIKSWTITGGANADQFSVAGAVLTYASQTVGGSYVVQVTATDYCDNTTNQTITATLTIKEFSSAATDKHAQIVLSGTPKLTIAGIAAGSQQNARFNADPSTSSVVVEWAPADFTDDIISFGADDASFDNSAYGLRPGLNNSNAFMFVTAAASAGGTWALDYGSAEPQSGSASDGHVNGDKYHHEFVPSTGTHKIFRIRSGVRTQLGSTVTGLSSSIKRACANTKNGGAVTANIGGSAWAATPTTGFSGYGA